MAADFIWRDPEAARQAIARLQLEAALAENQTRENIAKEQTAQQRYATQSQINEREKDRALSREDINARYGQRTNAEAERRGTIQYSTIRDSINVADPPTAAELEAKIAANPQLSDDLKNDLRSYREQAFKAAKANAATGERIAKNYKAELDDLDKAKYPDAKAKAALYKRINSDKDVLFDATTGTVASRWRMPREDAPVTAGMMGAAGYSTPQQDTAPSRSQMMNGGGGTATGPVRTLDDVRRQVTGGLTGDIGNAEPVAPSPAVTASELDVPPAVSSMYGVPSLSLAGLGKWISNNVNVGPAGVTFPNLSLNSFVSPAAPREPMSGPMNYGGGFAMPSRAGIRVSDFAPPPTSIPAPAIVAPRQVQSFDMPQYASPAGNMDALINMTKDPRFQTLPPEHQQWILDEIGNVAPRVSDLQTIRPEYRPPVEDYDTAPQ